MINNYNKILYIGADCHIEPVTHFKDTKAFVFIDTQPRSVVDSFRPNFCKYFYRHKFYSNLIENCLQYGFVLETTYEFDRNYYKKIMSLNTRIKYLIKFKKFPEFINPTLLIFKNSITNQIIHYYISTNIKFNMKPILQLDIENCDCIIIAGFHPDIELLNYIKHPITFIGYTGTCYTYTIENNDLYDSEKQNIIYFLETCHCNTIYYFKEFLVIVKETGIIYKCADFKDFKRTIENVKLNFI